MPQESATATITREAPPLGGVNPERRLRMHTRVRHGMTRPHNWIQLFKFVAVGGTGYAVNLAVFSFCVKVLGVHHLAAATVAFLVAVVNNFWWNRHWTFGAREAGGAHVQAARFFTVSVGAFLFQAGVLQLLVAVFALPAIVAQAISLIAATPLNFLGNKMWSFARRA